MFIKKSRFIDLLLRYSRGEELTQRQGRIVVRWLAKHGKGRSVEDLLKDEQWLWQQLHRMRISPSRQTWPRLQRRIADNGRPVPVVVIDRRRLLGLVSAAALIFLVIGFWLLRPAGISADPSTRVQQAMVSTRVPGVMLGGNGGMLILNSSSTVQIDNIQDGALIAEDGGMAIYKVDSNTLRYEEKMLYSPRTDYATGSGFEGTPILEKKGGDTYNYFATGLTRAYKLLFPDGSKIWLNKGSSIRYPLPLRGMGQKCNLNGEALFCIAKNSAEPLTVVANGITVQVLGTVFHVSGRSNEDSSKVSVYTGAVRVIRGNQSVKLSPFEEVVARQDTLESRKIKDFGSMLAWAGTPADFHFDNTSFGDAIAKIATWYQVSVYNPTGVKGTPIHLDMPRNMSLENLLASMQHMENGHVSLRLRGDSIIVTASGN